MEIAKSLIKKYTEALNQIRVDRKLLRNYLFTQEEPRHYQRLRLNIALFNDFRKTDYQIAKYLFEQESNWRKSKAYYETGEVDNLYFSALVVSKYCQPEMVLQFFETKMIDFDSSIGFDGEFLLSNGKEQTYQYLSNSNNELKENIYKYIGNSIETSAYEEEALKEWKAFKFQYFEHYIIPITDSMWFLYSTDEKELLKAAFESWLPSQERWTTDSIWKYVLYSGYLGDKEHLNRAKKIEIRLQKE